MMKIKNSIDAKLNIIDKILSNNNNSISVPMVRNLILEQKSINSLDFVIDKWRTLNDIDRLFVYFHIPYCRQKCLYCREDSISVPKKFDETAYISYLIESLEKLSIIFSKHKFSALYIGGGTPNIISQNNIDQFLTVVSRKLNFKKNAQKTFEFEPSIMTFDYLNILKKHKINRISFGVQSINQSVMLKMKRPYINISNIKKIVDQAKQLNFRMINIDLIFGLKGETTNSFLNSFNTIIKLNPTNVCVYPLDPPDNYISQFYNNKLELFNDEFNKKYSDLLERLQELSIEQGFKSDSPFNLSNKRGFNFTKNRRKNDYLFISKKPNSTLGIGKGAFSRIYGHAVYRDISKNLDIPQFEYQEMDVDYEIICFLSKNLSANIIDISNFAETYKIDFSTRYNQEIKYLLSIGKINMKNKQLVFNTNDSKQVNSLFLYFLTLKQLKLLRDNL